MLCNRIHISKIGDVQMTKRLIDAIIDPNTTEIETVLDTLNIDVNFELNRREVLPQDLIEQEIAAIPLHLAVFKNRPNFVESLLARGANPDLQDVLYEGCGIIITPLHLVLSTGNNSPEMLAKKLEIMDLLFYHGATFDEKELGACISTGVELEASRAHALLTANNTLLQNYAAHKVNIEFLYHVAAGNIAEAEKCLTSTFTVKNPYSHSKFCSFKITPNFEGGHYGTAVLLAAELPTSDMLEMLHRHNADLTITDQFGANAFHYAARKGSKQNINWLHTHLDATTTTNLLNMKTTITNTERTPLEFAVHYGHRQIALQLASTMIGNSNTRNQEGITLYQLQTALSAVNMAQGPQHNDTTSLMWSFNALQITEQAPTAPSEELKDPVRNTKENRNPNK